MRQRVKVGLPAAAAERASAGGAYNQATHQATVDYTYIRRCQSLGFSVAFGGVYQAIVFCLVVESGSQRQND